VNPRIYGAGILLALGATGLAMSRSNANPAPIAAAREAISVNVGDTVVPRFSIQTDTVLKVVGSSIVVRHCGSSFIYLRTWRKTTQLSADTVSVNAPCAASGMDTTVRTVSVYGAITRNADGSLSMDSTFHMIVGDTLKTCLHVVARNKEGQALTGLPANLRITDTTLAKFIPGGTCPDTTVDPVIVSLGPGGRIG
jgi:hypothetical protein